MHSKGALKDFVWNLDACLDCSIDLLGPSYLYSTALKYESPSLQRIGYSLHPISPQFGPIDGVPQKCPLYHPTISAIPSRCLLSDDQIDIAVGLRQQLAA